MNRSRTILCAVLLLGTGCAHQQAVQRVATLTAARTDDLKTEMSAFVDRANSFRESSAIRIGIFQDRARALQGETAATLQTWKATGDDKSKTARDVFDAVTVFGKTDSLPPVAPSLLGTSHADVARIKFDPAQYEALVKQLTALAKQRSILEEAQFLAAYGKAVDENFKKDTAKASKAVSATDDAATKATTEIAKP